MTEVPVMKYYLGFMVTACAAAAYAAAAQQAVKSTETAGPDTGFLERRDGNTVRYTSRTAAAKGNFYIKSEPPGATVFLNGKRIRNVVTPLTIENLPSGDYRINAEKADSAKSVDVLLGRNEFRKITLVLEKKQGKIIVDANVPDADVYLDGQFLGRTPVTVNTLDLGPYTLLVKKEGFIDFSRRVEISDLEGTAVKAELVRPGPLKVLSTPLEAEVWLDKEHKGATPIVLDSLSPGTHVLEFRREGYRVRIDTVAIVSGQETKVEPVLEPVKGAVQASGATGVGGGFDKAMKWLTVGGCAAFVVILSIVLAR
jgi:hypothetical protein